MAVNLMNTIDLSNNTVYVAGINGSTTLNYTTTAALTINTGVTTVSGGTGQPAVMLLGTDGFGIYVGTGAPSGLTAVTGSIYINKGGNNATSRLYINTTGASSWTAVNTVT